MADKHNPNIPQLANQISADIPDIKENLEWHKDILQMLIGWHDSTLASVSPPGPQRSKFRWKDGDEIYIGAGAYFHDGTTRQTVFWDAEITFVLQSGGSNSDSDDYGADGWHYIYLDDSAIVTQASPELDADCFLNETTAPTWSAAKHGWYNGEDKCIFAVYETGGVILEFQHAEDICFFADRILSFATADPGTDWSQAVILKIPAFATLGLIWVKSLYADGVSISRWRTTGQTGAIGHTCGYVANAANSTDSCLATVITNASQSIDIKITQNNNTMEIETDGWKFPIGM